MVDQKPLDPKTIAFIGTGEMGRPMILQLLKAGLRVNCFDVFKHTADEVVAAGAIWKDNSRECAKDSYIICTCLPLPIHVWEQMTGPDGACAGMSPGATWIDMSTTDYHNTLNVADHVKKAGGYSLESPVSNLSHMGVNFCNTSYLVAGDEQGWKNSQEYLDVTGKTSFYVGTIGMAQSTKLLTNDVFYTAVVHFGEACALVQEAGIPLWWWWDYIKASRGNTVASDQFAVFLFDGSWDKSCTLLIGVKDMSLTCEMADEIKEAMPISRITNEAYIIADKRYDKQIGHMQVCRITEEDNNIELRIPDWTAPSKYGQNTKYEHPPGMIRDEIGREKPNLPDEFKSPPFTPTPEQLQLAEDVCEFNAILNEAVYEEAVLLGAGMKVPEETVRELITWSVGTCWVSDNYKTYKPEKKWIDSMAEHVAKSSLKLRWFHKVEPVLRARNGWA